eukprot:531613-Pyramimonas_sp.AAC.1
MAHETLNTDVQQTFGTLNSDARTLPRPPSQTCTGDQETSLQLRCASHALLQPVAPNAGSTPDSAAARTHARGIASASGSRPPTWAAADAMALTTSNQTR